MSELLTASQETWAFTVQPAEIAEGGLVLLEVTPPHPGDYDYDLRVDGVRDDMVDRVEDADTGVLRARWDTTGRTPSVYTLTIDVRPKEPPEGVEYTPKSFSVEADKQVTVTFRPVSSQDTVPVTMRRAARDVTEDQVLWVVIRNRTAAISFQRYDDFITDVMCKEKLPNGQSTPVKTPFTDVEAYNLLKVATELFLMQEVGIIDAEQAFGELFEPQNGAAQEEARRSLREESRRLGFPATKSALTRLREDYFEDLQRDGVVERNVVLPYLQTILQKLRDIPLKDATVTPPNCYGVLRSRVVGPLALELIWSYWMEEGGLVQTLNLVSMRFQNRRPPGNDALMRLNLDPLRPLGNLLWGYIQDEPHRLSLPRRVYEYDHHYGLRLVGKAVPKLNPADSRSKFVEAFHSLLHQCSSFYPQDDDTTVVADGFPIMNALREVHLLLAEGAHNQFGDLPSTARVEMLIQQWLLARPEIRDYLGGRVMVPYAERWMDRVDTMRTMQRWNDASITHFRDLAVHGEQILLSIRYGNWNEVNDPAQAANWARYWRPEIQRYIHAYRGVTGIDLTVRADGRPPAAHLRQRAPVAAKAV